MMHTGGNDAKLNTRLSKSSPFEVKMLVEFIRRGISVNFKMVQPKFSPGLGEIDGKMIY